MSTDANIKIEIRDLTMAYGSFVVMRDINARSNVARFLSSWWQRLRQKHASPHMIGLKQPAKATSITTAFRFGNPTRSANRKAAELRRALPERRTLELHDAGRNIGLVLGEYTDFPPAEIREIARLKLALVGLKDSRTTIRRKFRRMCKRAGLARALALDPDVLFFDEPSAGLDPISSRNLDELILQLRDSLARRLWS